jgi:acetyl-CoA carboxylase biotin carboxyl carrier protein
MSQAGSKFGRCFFAYDGCEHQATIVGIFNGSKSVELKDIKAIIDLMKKNSVSEFELEKQDFKIRLKRGMNGGNPVVQYEDVPSVVYPAPVPVPPAATGTAPTVSAAPVVANEPEIKSPMIGTFYRSPSPESAAYVEVGTEVNPDTVVCIIEAMKVMNEIKAEVKGVITQVLVENAKPVEFGQPLFRIRPV